MDHLIVQLFPAAPGVGFFGDSGLRLCCDVSLGICPGHPQSHSEALYSLIVFYFVSSFVIAASVVVIVKWVTYRAAPSVVPSASCL